MDGTGPCGVPSGIRRVTLGALTETHLSELLRRSADRRKLKHSKMMWFATIEVPCERNNKDEGQNVDHGTDLPHKQEERC